jgi:hypothetical protein
VSERLEGSGGRVCELAELLSQLSERLGQFAALLLVLAGQRLASDALLLRSDEADFST